jgi:hypothetical protein
MNTDFILYFTAAATCLLIAHPIGDYFVQTDHQTQHKGLRGAHVAEGRWNCAKHAITYTLTQAAVMFTVFGFAGYDGPYGLVGVMLGLNGFTHYAIDRRWTLEAFARNIMRKGGWIDNDPGALATIDQAAHLALFLPVALGIAAISI